MTALLPLARMAAFDRLPPPVRRRLDGGAFNCDARALVSLQRRHCLSDGELLAVVDALDEHARPVAGRNQMDALVGNPDLQPWPEHPSRGRTKR